MLLNRLKKYVETEKRLWILKILSFACSSRSQEEYELNASWIFQRAPSLSIGLGAVENPSDIYLFQRRYKEQEVVKYSTNNTFPFMGKFLCNGGGKYSAENFYLAGKEVGIVQKFRSAMEKVRSGILI